MKIYTPFFIVATAVLFAFACNREEEITGCTNHLAENHDPRATVDDGSCVFSDAEQIIWKNGTTGGWNQNISTYGFVYEVCYGQFVAEADTAQPGDTPGVLITDDNGSVELRFKLLNPRTARNYNTGFVRFDILKPEGSELATFSVYTHGKVVEVVADCGNIRRSEPVQVSAQTAGSESFVSYAVPFSDFDELMFADIETLFGITVSGATPQAEVLHINNIRWTQF